MQKKFTLGWVAPTLWFLGALAIYSAVDRMLITFGSLLSGVIPSDPADAHYVKHALLISFHIIPGFLFLVLGPLQFISSIRSRWPKAHRISGRIFIACGFITAVSAIAINIMFPPFGGLFKSIAVYVFSLAQIFTLIVALRAILRREIARHRAWMIRAFAIGLAISTMRIFFIPAYLLYGMPSDFTVALGMWIGFLVNIAVAEFILWRERKTQRVKLG
ncbi:DUF2306 domain-containing protein [Cellvibrio zantedeschiae]|uniref:DUF2306 domain-containing protein n=1 Tax=Cellvibrio zantedeschiae TaxID=1237077 RepID=UPI001676A038|nr:DUF2306 domain-containing protein [Cellvibrio zantedeschiae]